VAAKFEIEKANMRVSRNIAISHHIVPVRVGNSGSPTAIREVLQIGDIGGFTTPGHYSNLDLAQSDAALSDSCR